MSSDARVSMEATRDGVRVRLPGPRGRWALLGLLTLLPIAAYVVLGNVVLVNAALASVRRDPAPTSAAIVAITVALLLLADVPVLVAAVLLLYRAAGREVVSATPWMLVHERHLLLLAHKHRWPAMRVSNLRLAPMSGGPADRRFMDRTGILFEVDGRRTRSMAEGCTPQEAAEVLATVEAALSAPTITR